MMQATVASLPDLQRLQRRRKRTLFGGIVFCIFLLCSVESSWRASDPRVYELIEHLGLFLILVCILGRTWCTLYIGGSKKRTLVTDGPYSVVRNPLYFFTAIGAAGVGAQSGSIALTGLLAAATAAVFFWVVRQEEIFLGATFPIDYAAYKALVPRFFPRPSLWREPDELLVRPHLVRRTFLDACLFLLAVPICDLIDLLQDWHWFPVSIHLP